MSVFVSPKLQRLAEQTYAHQIKTETGGEYGEALQRKAKEIKHLKKAPLSDRAADHLNYFTKLVEKWLTDWSAISAYYEGKRRGLTGRNLLQHMSNTAGKVNSFYNIENRPGIQRARIARESVPFQSYAFEAMNNVREVLLPGKKTGAYKTFEGGGLKAKRLIEFAAAMYAANMVASAVLGRDKGPWTVGSFFPYIGWIAGQGRYGQAAEPLLIRAAKDFQKAGRAVVYYDDWREARKFLLRYRVPAGTQIEKTLEGAEALSHGGQVKNKKGKVMFRIGPSGTEQVKALVAGPWATKAGAKYKREHFTKLPVEEVLGGLIPKNTTNRKLRNMRRQHRR